MKLLNCNWIDLIDSVVEAYRNTPQATTNVVPFEAFKMRKNTQWYQLRNLVGVEQTDTNPSTLVSMNLKDLEALTQEALLKK